MNAKIITIVGLILMSFVVYTIVRPLLHSPKGRVRIIMGGRSTTALWFKHWNWPYLLRIKTTYRAWPISYQKYSNKNLYFEYLALNSPMEDKNKSRFGEKMLKSFENGIDKDKYDVAFFKFCFVDFPVREDEYQNRFDDLTNIVSKVYKMTSKREMKLIVGNALPLPHPNNTTLSLQIKFNSWLAQFASTHDDVLLFDFFNHLTDQDGKFKMEFARSKNDHHLGEKAFTLLDKVFFNDVKEWLIK